MKRLVNVVAIIILCSSGVASAYKEVTHEDLTERAYDESQMTVDDTLFESLGIQKDEVFTTASLSKTNLIPDKKPKSPLYIMRSGATFEDKGLRPLNHFYDPYNDAGEDINVVGYVSPLWALEDKFEIPVGDQDYSYRDAREFLYQAITATADDGRDQSFSDLFRSLGQVVHHVQDMAQPQHVRNDTHLQVPIIGDPSLRERYTAGVTEGVTIDGGAVDAQLQDQLFAQFNGYAPVIFTKPRDYWEGDGDNEGKGLAEFTNREFVSKDTNFGMPDAKDYLSPDIDNATPFTVADVSTIFTAYGMSVPALCQSSETPCTMKFYSMQVTDNLRPEKSGQNSFATTESIFNQDIDGYNQTTSGRPVIKKRFTLNKLNFWSGYPFLMSRAVGYSSGLLNYFFRGRLEAENVGYSGNEVSFNLKNAVDSETYPEWAGERLVAGGELVVAYKYRSNGVEHRGVSDTVILQYDLYPEEATTARLAFNYNVPEGAFVYEERVIYKGQIGEEGGEDFNAIAVGSFQPISVLFSLVGDIKSSEAPYTRTLSVLRSRDAGRTWEIALDKFYTKGPSFYDGGLVITSEGTGKLRVVYETHERNENAYTEYRSLQICTDDAGVAWHDCSLPTFRENNPRHNESSVFNTGSSFIARQLDARNLPDPGTRIYTTLNQGETWLYKDYFSSYSSPDNVSYPRGFRKYGTGELSFLIGGPYDCDGRYDQYICDPDQSKMLSEFVAYPTNPGGTHWRLVRFGVNIDQLKFYSSSRYFAVAADWENMLDVNRHLVFIRDGNNLGHRITDIRFTDDNGVTDFQGVSTAQFSKKNRDPRFVESAYLGNGRLILRLDESYNSDRAINKVGNRLLLSEDYGLTWESVNSLNITGASGELDKFNYTTGHPLSGILGMEAVALTPEGLYVIK